MLGKVMSMTGIKTTADKKAEKDANAEANKAACQALSQKEFEKTTVLVTGAAGSIGSEICRQLSKYNLTRLV
jgi:FlaA1/EpsC-like NDP-sugar epimerase